MDRLSTASAGQGGSDFSPPFLKVEGYKVILAKVSKQSGNENGPIGFTRR